MELNGSFQKGEFKDELGKIQYKKYNNNKLKKLNVKLIGVPNMPKVGKMGVKYPKRQGSNVLQNWQTGGCLWSKWPMQKNEEGWTLGVLE